MHRFTYETGRIKIIAHCQNETEEMISFNGCFDTNFTGKLPGVFSRRDTKVFSSRKIVRSLNIVETVECIGPVRYCDLKRCLPTIFDVRHINRINDAHFAEENRDLIIRLASDVIGEEEALRILESRSKNFTAGTAAVHEPPA